MTKALRLLLEQNARIKAGTCFVCGRSPHQTIKWTFERVLSAEHRTKDTMIKYQAVDENLPICESCVRRGKALSPVRWLYWTLVPLLLCAYLWMDPPRSYSSELYLVTLLKADWPLLLAALLGYPVARWVGVWLADSQHPLPPWTWLWSSRRRTIEGLSTPPEARL